MRDILLNMPQDHFWIWAIGMGLIGLFAFATTFIYFYLARIIEDTPTSRIRSAAQGYVELEGLARAFNGQPIISKLSQTPCLWYKYKIEKYVGGKNDKWRTLEENDSKEFFLLEDATGHCLIDPAGARVNPLYKKVWTGNSKYPAPGSDTTAGTTFLGMSVITSGTYRYTEQRLHENDFLYALGDFKTFSNPKHIPTLNQEVRQYLNQLKRDPVKLHKHFDKNGDGEIDQQEWEQARKAVIEHVTTKYQSEANAGIHLLEKPAERRHPFLLSAFPQDDLVRKYKRYSSLGLAGFFVAGGFAVYMLVVRLAGGA
ncbi:MAG: GIDE domain-containing protein [Gammaproteobacteria bacterium]